MIFSSQSSGKSVTSPGSGKTWKLAIAVAVCWTATVDPEAQNEPPTTPPTAIAIRVEDPPKIDGNVLNDPVWENIPGVSGFWQTTPDEGQPSSEHTEIRILYTRSTLYFGVICYDRDPDSIIISDTRRDSPLDESDSFQIILDTYHDRQNGFVFGTNPVGIEYDGQVTDEGQGAANPFGFQTSASGGGFNINWDSSWEVKAEISKIGWTAEFAIPFRTLRFPQRDSQTWGINFQRDIRRRKERSFWAPLPRQFNLFRLSLAGRITDLEISTPRNLKLVPYTLGEVRKQRDSKTNWLGTVGGDLKYSITPSLTLDVTYNTDFAQVEVDEQQINMDRFDLFFPEKRPFFLENAGLFAVGEPEEVELFFSRRIGIGPEGEIIPIVAGARLTGKLGGTNIGFLNMQTEEGLGVTPANNFTVARASRELPHRSSLGAIFVNRQGTGDAASERDHNRTYGVDGRWGIGEYGELAAFAAQTSTPDSKNGQYAYRVSASYNSAAWLLRGAYMEVAEDFNPEVGFLQRRGGFRKPDILIWRRYRPKSFWGLHELRPHVSYVGYWNPDGFQESGLVHLDNHLEWKNGHEIHTQVNFTREGITQPFEISPNILVPEGTYDDTNFQFTILTNQGAPLSVRVGTFVGGFFGGDRMALTPSMRFRVGEAFNTELSLEHNDIDLPGGSFETNLGRARISYSFNPKVFVETLIQYNDRADIWSMNFRFGWLQTANVGLFVVYNHRRGFNDLVEDTPDRSLVVKFSRLFDLLD